MIIYPFETGNVENLNGKDLSDLLRYELNSLADFGSKQTAKYPPALLEKHTISKNFTRNFTYSYLEGGKSHDVILTSRYNQSSEFPPISPEISPESYVLAAMLSQLDEVKLEGTSIPLGDLILISRQANGRDINCSINKYNSSIVLIAILEDHKAKKIQRWEVKKDLHESNQSIEELAPLMIKDLAFQLAYDFSKKNLKEGEEYPQTWQTFKNIVEGHDAYFKYLSTKDLSQIDSARKKALDVLHNESGNSWSYNILPYIGVEYIGLGNYD